MTPIRLIRPEYAKSFECIGSDCEDTCCRGWSVPIDKTAYEKFQSLPNTPLRAQILSTIQLAPEGAKASEGYGPAGFAKLKMDESNQCPLLTADRLCRIHAECGEEVLAPICATYPRIVHSIGSFEEKALALSCPEAARVVLLNPHFKLPIERAANTNGRASWLPPYFWPIRETVLALIRNRTYPLWKRLFLLGVFCRRLEAIASGEHDRTVPEFLADFRATVASGALNPAMEAAPVDHRAQLDVVLRLAGLMLQRSNVTQRFVECIHAFTEGIGNGPTATLDSLTARYAVAHDRYYAPYLEQHPYVMENYLINTISRCQFPFGVDGMKEGGVPSASNSMTREFATLTSHFVLTKGLLIGVAGFHREAFSANHIVHTVQASSKHFDHHPEFPKLAHELLVESRLDGALGLTILLRNAEPTAPKSATQPIYAPGPSSETGTFPRSGLTNVN